MDEGIKGDNIKKFYSAQLTSARGLDLAFIAQYRDRIIFDCVTSVKQPPIRFPMPKNSTQLDEWKLSDPDF